ncbi:hypothetical protein [Puniceicoccus vermicola]|uniref:Uncharacterized protein n=1 Tax=Puniceicoccus vermicola TaxID=388746 RepID=A0A7X1E6N7_9BACT|nr:hypothetical protein [Puniceicoccus vermicola]MBC2602857.1 hypothetical protein [Puniceicoccus vermicola]
MTTACALAAVVDQIGDFEGVAMSGEAVFANSSEESFCFKVSAVSAPANLARVDWH